MKISLRWKLILFSACLALGTELVFTALLHFRTKRLLRQGIEKVLETKCDEVITVLKSADLNPTLQDFLLVETNYRFSPYAYFYQIRHAQGRTLARSRNLGDAELPIPEAWRRGDFGSPVHFQTLAQPLSPEGQRILLRSERLELAMAGREPALFVIQTAASLGAYESTVRESLRGDVLVSACSLAAVFFLLWFVTTRSLRPVSAMTRKASQITAANLRERLPRARTADELDELARVLNDMLDRLGASIRQMVQFSSDAAHQLRTPLTRIRGELDLILRSGVSDPPRSQLERIQEELERLSRVCGRLLLLARLDQQVGNGSLFDERLDLEEVVSELLEQMAPVAQDRGVQLRRGATSTVRVRGSRPLIVEALLNLLDNAIRATPVGGFVAVSLDANGDGVRLSVEDSGPGVPPEERQRIFQRFYRIPRTSAGAADDGSGLGLAIVQGIAQAHGGHVEIVEAPRGGSVFRVVFPPLPPH
jgi:heavy metal sensor kinase